MASEDVSTLNISAIKSPVLQKLAKCIDEANDKEPISFSNYDFGYKKDDKLNDAEYGAFIELANYLVKEKKCSKEDLAQVKKMRDDINFNPRLYDVDIGLRLFGKTKVATEYSNEISNISLELSQYDKASFKKTVRDFTNWWNNSLVGKHMKIDPPMMKRKRELTEQLSNVQEKLNDYTMSEVLKKIGFSE